MSRLLAGLALLVAAAPLAAAPPLPGEPVPLTLNPAALPVPASKYRLMPDGRDLVPGNAAAIYYRSMSVYSQNRALLDELKGGQWDLWLDMPLDQLPQAEVGARLDEQQYLLDQLGQAARCKQCDWELNGRPEGIALLLPEVQTFRAVVRVVAVKARYELAAGHIDAALRALKPGYAFAHRLGEGQTLIHVLVGAAMAMILDREVEEILQQPGCPNLYWALAVLPRPFIDPRESIDEEGTLLERSWPAVKRIEDGPMSADQVHAFRRALIKDFRPFGIIPATPLDYLHQTWEQSRAYPEARRSLLAQGMPAEEVDAMPLTQVVALDAVRRYHRAWDDYVQWTHVAGFARQAGAKQAQDRLKEAGQRLEKLVLFPKELGPEYSIFGSPLPLDKIYTAVGRVDRRFAGLRCVEAIRLYAADHGGRLPARLADITAVPVPVDPVTDRPFEYEVKGEHATLKAPLQDGARTSPYERLTYQIALRR
jgi:hypothetical protein